MKKFAIAVFLSVGTFVSFQSHAGDRAVIGAVDGALVGSYFGGAHGAVAGAIIGAVVGSSVDDNYDRRGPVRYERGYRSHESAPVYYAAPPVYQAYYEPRYEPRRVIYVAAPVYESYPIVYPRYRAPVYVERYVPHRRAHYAPRHEYYDRRGRY